MYKIPLKPEKFYHVYNHAVGRDNIFKNESNFYFFLKKYEQYISLIADTFAYCLMPNHFHAAIQIKSKEEIKTEFKEVKNDEDILKTTSKQFRKLFSSYAQAFNIQQNRKWKLFERKL